MMVTLAHHGLSPVRRTLSSGGTVLIQQTATHPAVTLYATLPAGNGFDADPLLGRSNFVARVIDRGTERRPTERLAEDLDGRGVSLGTSVTRHLLSLSCTCLADDLQPILDIVSDVLRRPTFPAEQVERRRGTIVTAIRQDEDNPAAVAMEGLMSLLYPGGHPYGRPPLGTVQTVEGITRDDLVQFYRAQVGGAGLRLVIVGDVLPERAAVAAEDAFGDWKVLGGQPLRPPPVVHATDRRIRVTTMPGKAQTDIAYGFTTITRSDPRYYALILLNNVLGQYALGGRLGDSIRERQGMAYYVFSSFDANIAEGPLVIRAGVSPSNIDRTIQSIDEEVERMAKDGVTAEELADSKRYLIGSMPRMLETNGGIASFLHDVDYFGLGLDFDRRVPSLLDAVTLEEVNDVARTFLAADRASIWVAGPPVEDAEEAAA
jgi:zinc protease